MAAGQRYYLCKMLSGPHLGAEVRLAAGSYRVGRDDAADIVLEDQAMAVEHALLAIEPDGVCVEPLLGEVLIDRVAHKDPVKRLPFFTVLGLGTTYLAIGPEDAAWPVLAVPPPWPDGQAASAESPAAPGATADPPPVKSRRWFDQPWAALAALLLVLAVVPLPGSLGRDDEVRPVPAAPPPDPAQTLAAAQAAVAEALRGVEVDGLTVTPDPRRERLLVEGWVPTEVERKAVLERLAALSLPLTPRVWSRDGVMGGVATAVQALGRPLEVSWAGAGEVDLKGYIASASDLQRVVDLLQRDVAGLKGVRNEVMTDDAVEAWLSRRLAEAGLTEVLRVKRGNQTLSVRGELTAGQRQAFREIAADYAQGPGRFLGLEAQIVQAQELPQAQAAVAPAMAQFELRFFGTVRRDGLMAALVARDGEPGIRRVSAGDAIDEWEVKEVTRERLVLVREGGDEAVFSIASGLRPASLRQIRREADGTTPPGPAGSAPGAVVTPPGATLGGGQVLAVDERRAAVGPR